MFENIRNPVIVCYDRLIDREPESQSQWLDSSLDVASGIEVGVAGIPAIPTGEKSLSASTDFMAQSARFAGIFGTDIDNRTSYHRSFVIDKALELTVSPRMESSIESSSLAGSDIYTKLFHSHNISCSQTVYNFSTNPMVFVSHKTCPSARQSFEMPFGRFRSFALQSSDEPLMLEHLGHNASIELPVGSNSKVLYSDIDAENASMLSSAQINVDVFGKAQAEKYISIPAYPYQAFTSLPVRITRSIFRHRNIKLLSTFESGYIQDSVFIRETTRRIESHRLSGNSRLAFGSFDHSASLLDTGDRKLCRQASATQMLVNKRMQSDIVSDSLFPSHIYTMLHSCPIQLHCLQNNGVFRKLEIDSYATKHKQRIEVAIINTSQFLLPTCWEVSLRRRL